MGRRKECEKCATVEVCDANLPVRTAQYRYPVPVGLPPVVATVDIENVDRGPIPAQRDQFLQHQFAQVAAAAAVEEQFQHPTTGPGWRQAGRTGRSSRQY